MDCTDNIASYQAHFHALYAHRTWVKKGLGTRLVGNSDMIVKIIIKVKIYFKVIFLAKCKECLGKQFLHGS